VNTNIGRSDNGFLGRIIQPFIFRRGLTVEEGAETLVYLASSAEVEGISGRYFVKKKEKRSVEVSYDRGLQERLWQVSEELAGI
jgi:hypothetical protein